MGVRGTTPLLWGLIGTCLIPLALQLVGVDLGFEDASRAFRGPYEALRGAFVHTLLEGGAVSIALTTGLLAALYYRVSGGYVAPVLALALLFGGVLDGVHILASDRLIGGIASDDFLPFSWAIARLFNASILVIGIVTLVLGRHRFRDAPTARIVGWWSVALAVLAAATALWILGAESLPDTTAASGPFTRPWDVIPLALYLVVLGLALPSLLKTDRGPFVQSVWLSAWPAIATQAYMAFGSTALFDHYFVSAHFLKIVSYGVPLAGLFVEYQEARAGELAAMAERTRAEVRRIETERRVAELEALTTELERSNRELEQFAYVASHDLKAPLRAVSHLTTWLAEDLKDHMSQQGHEYVALIQNRVARLESFITSLLEYSRIGKAAVESEPVDVGEMLHDLVGLLDPEGVEVSIGSEMPVVDARRTEVRQVLLNLLSNACRHAKSRVDVSVRETPVHWEFEVADDGPGIAPEYQDRIWGLFTRLDARDEVEGTGLGLALIRKVTESWGGGARVESTPGEGARFFVTLPKEPRSAAVPDHVMESRHQPATVEEPAYPAPDVDALLAEGRAAIESFDPDWLGETLKRAAETLSPRELVEDLLGPLTQIVGELWFHDRIGVRHEHLASAAIRRAIDDVIEGASSEEVGRPHLVAATPSGERHELGLLLATAAAAATGWRVTYLGPDLPPSEFADAVAALGADALALSLVYDGREVDLREELEQVRDALESETLVIVGGRVAAARRGTLESAGARVVADLGEAATLFEALKSELRSAYRP